MNSPITLDVLIDIAGDHARRVLIEHKQKQLMPSFLLIQADDSAQIVQVEIDNNELHKQLMLAKVKALMQERGTVKYSFVTEAWQSPEGIPQDQVKRDAEGHTVIPERLRPRYHPDRIEVVMAFATDGMETRYRQWRIKRDYKGAIRDLEFDKDMDSRFAMSRFADLLTKGTA